MIGRCIRRLGVLVLLAAAGAVLYSRLRGSHAAAPTPAWPPFDPAPHTSSVTEPAVQPFAAAPEAPSAATVSPDPSPSAARWVAPVDGQCPEGFPIKANDNSGIFHVPGGRFYARTVPERCYAAAEDAVADGYRQAKA